MEQIIEAQRAIESARTKLQASVAQARAEGRTWAEIGEVMGMSRQAAFKRFGEATNPTTGDPVVKRSAKQMHELTEHVFTLIAAGEQDKLQELMHPQTKEELPASLIAETWAGVLAEVGSLESMQGTRAEMPDGEVLDPQDESMGVLIGQTTLRCEAGEYLGRVAADEQLRVVGLLIVRPDYGPLPF